MTKFELKEKAVAIFQNALNAAGMQRSTGREDKPKYWRGFVKDTAPAIYLLFQVTDNLELEAADNKSFRRLIYINGSLYSRNGMSDEDYQILASAIENECEKANILFNFSDEGIDTSIDPDSPISYCNFEAQIRLLMD